LNEFDHTRRVEGTNCAAASLSWNEFVLNGATARTSGQIDELLLRIIKLIGLVRYLSHTNAQPSGDPLPVSKQPSLHRTYGNAKAHSRRWRGKPLLKTRWRTVATAVQIDKSNPGAKARCVIITAKRLKQGLLSLSPMHSPKRKACVLDNSTKHSLVKIALHSAGENYHCPRSISE
jgi:hypothetical protein